MIRDGQQIKIMSQAEVYFEDSGIAQQNTILFFNGASLPLTFWDPLVTALSPYARCIRFDQRNAGNTRCKGPFSLNDIAADAAAVLAAQNVEQVVAIGHAWGGRAAQVFARDYPHLVQALVICGTGGALPATTDPAVLRQMKIAFKEKNRPAWETALHETYCASGFRQRDPEAFAEISALLWQAPRSDAIWNAKVSPSPSYWGSAVVPTMLIYGTEDKNGTPENARNLDAALANSYLTFVADAGHFVIREQVADVAQLIRNFLADPDNQIGARQQNE